MFHAKHGENETPAWQSDTAKRDIFIRRSLSESNGVRSKQMLPLLFPTPAAGRMCA